jgi:hypothetical protein
MGGMGVGWSYRDTDYILCTEGSKEIQKKTWIKSLSQTWIRLDQETTLFSYF